MQMLAYLGRYHGVIDVDALNVSDVRFAGGTAARIAEASTDAMNGSRLRPNEGMHLTTACAAAGDAQRVRPPWEWRLTDEGMKILWRIAVFLVTACTRTDAPIQAAARGTIAANLAFSIPVILTPATGSPNRSQLTRR